MTSPALSYNAVSIFCAPGLQTPPDATNPRMDRWHTRPFFTRDPENLTNFQAFQGITASIVDLSVPPCLRLTKLSVQGI